MLLADDFRLVAATLSMLLAYPLAVHLRMLLHVCVPNACPACCNDSAVRFTSAPPGNLTKGVLYESNKTMSQRHQS